MSVNLSVMCRKCLFIFITHIRQESMKEAEVRQTLYKYTLLFSLKTTKIKGLNIHRIQEQLLNTSRPQSVSHTKVERVTSIA